MKTTSIFKAVIFAASITASLSTEAQVTTYPYNESFRNTQSSLVSATTSDLERTDTWQQKALSLQKNKSVSTIQNRSILLSSFLLLDISTDNGQSWTSVETISSPQQKSDVAPWTLRTVDLSSYRGRTIILRTVDAYNGTTKVFTSDNFGLGNLATTTYDVTYTYDKAGNRTVKQPNPGCNINVWIGSGSTDWHTSANWSLASVPTDCQPVVIPDGNSNCLISTGMTGVCKYIEVDQGAEFDVMGLLIVLAN